MNNLVEQFRRVVEILSVGGLLMLAGILSLVGLGRLAQRLRTFGLVRFAVVALMLAPVIYVAATKPSPPLQRLPAHSALPLHSSALQNSPSEDFDDAPERLRFSHMAVHTNRIDFAASWPQDADLGLLALYRSPALDPPDWELHGFWTQFSSPTGHTWSIARDCTESWQDRGFFLLQGHGRLADGDGDGVPDAREIEVGTDPFSANSDGDCLTDGEELGTVEVLEGDGFLWLDASHGFPLLPGAGDSGIDNLQLWGGRHPLGDRTVLGAAVVVDGYLNLHAASYGGGSQVAEWSPTNDLRTTDFSCGGFTVMALDADLSLRSAWGSRVYSDLVETDGREYDVFEWVNVGCESPDGAACLATFEIVIPHAEPGVVYVSYLSVDPAFPLAGMRLGIQDASQASALAPDEFYTVSCPVSGSLDRKTFRYVLGHNTDPLQTDSDWTICGQGEDWVRATFANADEINAVGYANWVDARIGVGLTNGLYKFKANFTEAPAEPVRLDVGDYSVTVTNAGEYAFVLEKGVRYSFRTVPHVPTVVYSAQDDLGAAASRMSSSPPVDPELYEWTEDGVVLDLRDPFDDTDGTSLWYPCLKGMFNCRHLIPDDFPKTFFASLTDIPAGAHVSYHWSASNPNIQIHDPDAVTTEVTLRTMPDLAAFGLSVTARFLDVELVSTLNARCGYHDPSRVNFSLEVPEIVFLNDDNRETRWYRVKMSVTSPVETNVTLTVSHTGSTGIRYASDSRGLSPLTLSPISCRVSGDDLPAERAFYFACSECSDSGAFEVTCRLEDGRELSERKSYKVVEPLRRLVCSEYLDGKYVNPSRLVYGESATLKVDWNGSVAEGDVRWWIVSGPGRIVSFDLHHAEVEATNDVGTVIVEASFGRDSWIHPRFVLPIVKKRWIPLSVYYVCDTKGKRPDRLKQLMLDLDIANEIFQQVGVGFYLAGEPQPIGDASYANLPEYRLVTNDEGVLVRSGELSDEATYLLQQLQDNHGGINLVYVWNIIEGTELAFAVAAYNSVVLGKQGSTRVLAHELGHCLGMDDIYYHIKGNEMMLMTGWSDSVSSDMFNDRTADWGMESGRAFYASEDINGDIVYRLLMYGGDVPEAVDIPSGAVMGLSAESTNRADKVSVSVGANTIWERLRR